MPHDKNGQKIEKGDLIAVKAWWDGQRMAGARVLGVSEGSDTCNVVAAPVDPGLQHGSFNANETEILLKHDGSKPEKKE